MVLKLYKNNLSPPARATMMVTELIKVPVLMIDVDLMKAEHKEPEFLKVGKLYIFILFYYTAGIQFFI